MRKLTFKGYLEQYVYSLSKSKTNGLYQLAKEASTNNPRLREPLLLYALFANKSEVLLKATKDKDLRLEYLKLLSQYNVATMEQALIHNDPSIPERYSRVHRSYVVVSNKTQNENQTKLLMRNRIMELQQQKNVSSYRIYKDLKINHGNFTAFLNHSDCQKLSLDKARATLAYLEAFE